MAATIVTLEDLVQLKSELLEEINKLLEPLQVPPPKGEPPKWLKSHQVQRQLGISPGTLQNLRINGTIPYTKIGGVIFYNQEDITALFQRFKRNEFNNGKK